MLFVTDNQRHLEGVVTVKDLLMNPYEAKIGDIMEDNVIKCVTTDDQEDVADLFNRYDLLSVPVVDQENRLVGIVTVDDAVDVMEDEATEDIEKMAAIIPTERPYFKTGVFETWKSRIPWLMLLMVSATFTGIIINNFENALAACVALTGFIPMLMDTSGNCGSQSSVTVIRAMSLGDVEFKDIFRVIWKEIRVAGLRRLSGHRQLCEDLAHRPSAAGQRQHYPHGGRGGLRHPWPSPWSAPSWWAAPLPMLAEKLGFDPAVMASPSSPPSWTP